MPVSLIHPPLTHLHLHILAQNVSMAGVACAKGVSQRRQAHVRPAGPRTEQRGSHACMTTDTGVNSVGILQPPHQHPRLHPLHPLEVVQLRGIYVALRGALLAAMVHAHVLDPHGINAFHLQGNTSVD